MTTKLALYNKAATHLSQTRLVALTDEGLLRRELDAVYDATLQGCLEEGLWRWSLRTVELSYDPDIDTSDFGGLAYGFSLPSDWVRAESLATDPNFNVELGDHKITGPGKLLFSNSSTIYASYVSNGATYGLNLAVWPEVFADGVGARLAQKIAIQITKSAVDEQNCEKKADRWFAQAKMRFAIEDRVKFRPAGVLVRARRGFDRVRTRGPIWG